MLDPTSLLNKMLVVGLTRVNRKGEVVEQIQVHGRIQSFSPEDGLLITTEPSGRPFRLPPDLSALQPAPPGTFREHSTGISVEDPDFMAMWQVHEATDAGTHPSWVAGPRIHFPTSSENDDQGKGPGSGA